MLAKYAYDTLGRLTQTQDGATGTPIETYAYDATGNRTALTTSAGTASYTYPATSHRLTAVDGEARNHDAVGNTTSIGGKTFIYNDANRMNAVKQGNAVLESYGYNHRGERVLRTPAGGAAQIALYNEAGQWLGNYSATGQAQQQAIWLDNYPVALINVPSTGVPELAYVQSDHLGTPRVVIDPVRDVAIWEWSNKSEVFGNQIPSADPDGDGVVFELALRFPGRQATDASGLFYNYQREYDPAVGRYSQSDPIGLAAGPNTFGYVMGNPMSWIDPEGLEVLVCSQPAFGVSNNPIDHQWIRTDTVEAGMGGTRGNVPDNDSGDMPGDPVQVTNHVGRSNEPGASCKVVKNVDEARVNSQLQIGRSLGRCGPANHCQSFVAKTLWNASTVELQQEQNKRLLNSKVPGLR